MTRFITHWLTDVLRRPAHWLRRKLYGRRAAVAVVVALSAPVLIASTGLAIDVGYWYQQQDNLQLAADAAAMAAASAELNNSSAITTASAAMPYAQLAANNASGGRYNLNGGGGVLTLSISSTTSPASGTAWLATASAPRQSFLLRATGSGLSGIGAGMQNASATAEYFGPTVAPICLYTTAAFGVDINANGGSAAIKAPGCGIYSASTTCANFLSSIISNSDVIYGKTTTTAAGGCAYAANGAAYIGTFAGYSGAASPSAGSGVTSTATVPAMPGTIQGPLPAMPAMQYAPTPPVLLLALQYTNLFTNYVSAQTGFYYAAIVNLLSYGPTAVYLGTTGASSTTMATTGTTEIGGISYFGNAFSTLNFGGAAMYVTGATSISLTTAVNFTSTTTSFAAGLSFNNSSNTAVNFGAGTYYLGTGLTALNLGNSQTSTTQPASSFYFNGAINSGNNNIFTFAKSSLYMFTDTLASFSGTLNFTGGTYYFSNGLYMVNGGTNVVFGPGIYYINGILDLAGAASVTAHGATFVLEGQSSYIINSNGGSINLAAPDDAAAASAATGGNPSADPNYDASCVEPASFPVTADVTAWPYDGSGGHGICGVLIYQPSTDIVADAIPASASLTGIIYQPGAALALLNGNIAAGTAANTSGTLEIVANNVYDPNATLNLSAGTTTPSGGSGSSATIPVALLTQ